MIVSINIHVLHILSKPLVQYDEIKLEFDLEAVTRCFTDNNPRDELAKNGSRLHLSVYEATEYFPTAGFITNIRETTGLDVLLATTAHEIAHNWWPLIVTPAWSEGMAILAEAIAQYVSVMCLEKEYGKPMIRRLLKEEMASYLSRRKEDMIGERPMTRHYPWQTYLTYEKSLLAMYALQDAIGEDRVNLALKKIFHQYQYNHNVFPTPLDLINAFREVTPPELQYVITDLFETITLYDNQAVSALAEQQENGKYKVKLKIFSRKLRANSQGKETEIPVNDYMYIVVLDKNRQELYLKKHKINRQEMEIEIIVDKEPAKAGIDPFFILIDRDHDNNLVKIDFDTP